VPALRTLETASWAPIPWPLIVPLTVAGLESFPPPQAAQASSAAASNPPRMASPLWDHPTKVIYDCDRYERAAATFEAPASSPMSRALSCQSLRATDSSRARGAGGTSFPSSKYWPVVSDNSGLVTSCTMRRPPCSGEMKLNFPITQMIGLAQPGAPDQIAVATAP